MKAAIRAIDYVLADTAISNADLNQAHPEWSVEKISSKTGIHMRYACSAKQCASDLAVAAAEKLLHRLPELRNSIDMIMLCTQSPDYFLPTTACLVQERLGLPTTTGALDFNLGCSGYVYGLSIAKGLIESEQAKSVLLITAEAYSQYISPNDKSVKTLFSDAAAATLITAVDSQTPLISKAVLGTDGRGAENLIVKTGASRHPATTSTPPTLQMNGGEIFTFALSRLPELLQQIQDEQKIALGDYDLFIFHQANRYMLNQLRKKLGIPEEKFYTYLAEVGNTVSSTIPIALKEAFAEGRLTQEQQQVMLVGFGVGYSWGGVSISCEAFVG